MIIEERFKFEIRSIISDTTINCSGQEHHGNLYNGWFKTITVLIVSSKVMIKNKDIRLKMKGGWGQ